MKQGLKSTLLSETTLVRLNVRDCGNPERGVRLMFFVFIISFHRTLQSRLSVHFHQNFISSLGMYLKF